MNDDHIHLPSQQPDKPNSPVIERGEMTNAPVALASAICYWNGEEYSDGATICSAHIVHKCWNGKWVELGSC